MSDIIFKTLLLKGEAGGNIKNIKKTSSNGLVDTYTVTLTDGVTTTFEVTNGKSIVDIKKTGSTGLVDNYKISYNDGTSSTFSVTNGNGIKSILKTDSNGLVDTYTITYDNGKTDTLEVKNGEGATVVIDNALSKTSTNPVQNKVITNRINDVSGRLNELNEDVASLVKGISGISPITNSDIDTILNS